MRRLLHHLATYQDCVDLRDRALLYLRLLTHAGSASLGTLFHDPSPGEVEEMTRKLTPVLPKTIRLVHGPVPFLRFFKSFDERRRLGIQDGKCALLTLPLGRRPSEPIPRGSGEAEAFASSQTIDRKVDGQTPEPAASDAEAWEDLSAADWEERWGDKGDDYEFPVEGLRLAQAKAHASAVGTSGNIQHQQEVQAMLQGYMDQGKTKSTSIRLPFVLVYTKGPSGSKWLEGLSDYPRQLFSLELTFSSSEHFVPITPIRIPYIAATAAEASEPIAATGSTLVPRGREGFPCSNKLLLKLQPISPVPTSFGVNVAFNDSSGHMYFGQLETFHVAFQDLFLPVRMPLIFWTDLFQHLWKGGLHASPCWSVKVLDLDRASVVELLGYCSPQPYCWLAETWQVLLLADSG